MKQPRDIKSRIMNKVKIDTISGCWNWQGSKFIKKYSPYGQMRMNGRNGKTEKAHRVSYRYFIGEIPDTLEIDHLCHNTLCVNPEHLEAVTHKENMQRRKYSRLILCKNGHKYTDDTTYIRPDNGRRECRVCRSIRRNTT